MPFNITRTSKQKAGYLAPCQAQSVLSNVVLGAQGTCSFSKLLIKIWRTVVKRANSSQSSAFSNMCGKNGAKRPPAQNVDNESGHVVD